MKRKTSNTDLRTISKDEQEIVRGYVLFRPLYRPNITIAKTIPFIGAYLCIVGGIVFWKGWMIGIIGGLIILLVLARVILIKLIDAKDNLSIQVHPDDKYAEANENQYGKTEGWLILDANENSNIVVGHNAKNKEELIEYINKDDFNGLLNEIKVNPGEFYPIPSGTIHALGKNLVLLEVQQSSDVTYRFYDYHRKDKDGNERPLHVEKAIEVTDYNKYDQEVINIFKEKTNIIWDNEFFKVEYLEVNEKNTTKECCICGDKEKKDPKIREFTCKNCGTKVKRDINSAVNIGKKAGYCLDVERYKENWSEFLYQGRLDYGRKIKVI